MKKCTKCGIEKIEQDFAQKNGGRSSRCKSCHNDYYKEYWKRPGTLDKQRERLNKNKKKYIDRNRLIVYEALKSGCIDCSELDIRCLEFDHLGDKKFNVSRLLSTAGEDRLRAEIAKCVVRCANCHRKKTSDDFNWWKSSYSTTADS